MLTNSASKFPRTEQHLEDFLANIAQAQQQVQEQLEQCEFDDVWNTKLLYLFGPATFISDDRAAYALWHSRLLELLDRLNLLELQTLEYYSALNDSTQSGRQHHAAKALLANWEQLIALQKRFPVPKP